MSDKSAKIWSFVLLAATVVIIAQMRDLWPTVVICVCLQMIGTYTKDDFK